MSLKEKKLQWIKPLEVARKVAANYSKNWIFLYSGLNYEEKNSISIIALFPKKELYLDRLSELKKYLQKSSNNYDDSYFGYVSYEYKNYLENFAKTEKSFIDLPEIYFTNFALILEFNHDKNSLNAYFEHETQLQEVLNYKEKSLNFLEITVEKIDSNFSSFGYLQEIDKIKKMIAEGDFYQTNLTRKFFGTANLLRDVDYFNIFEQLTTSSAANYSSFIKIDDNFIISTSPELFLKAQNNKILSRPIKGTASRADDKEQDEKNKNYLQNSQKERAENLMIVDLVRNDLSRICKAASVTVKNLFKINSYKNLHAENKSNCSCK